MLPVVSDGPLFCPLDLFLFLSHSHSILFLSHLRPMSFPSHSLPLVHSFNCCSHLLLDGPLFCPQDRFISHSHSHLFHPILSHFHHIPFSFPSVSCHCLPSPTSLHHPSCTL